MNVFRCICHNMFSVNKEKYTNDKIIRKTLIKLIENQYNGYADEKIIVEEFPVCNGAAIIDVAAINGVMHGFEIKSDVDSLERLPRQIEFYNSVFDEVTLIVGATHLYHAFYMIPDWWGITMAKMDDGGEVTFDKIRESEQNTKLEAESVASLLWKDEALSILDDIGISYGYKSKNKKQIYERLIDELDIQVLSEKVRSSLFNRQGFPVGV